MPLFIINPFGTLYNNLDSEKKLFDVAVDVIYALCFYSTSIVIQH